MTKPAYNWLGTTIPKEIKAFAFKKDCKPFLTAPEDTPVCVAFRFDVAWVIRRGNGLLRHDGGYSAIATAHIDGNAYMGDADPYAGRYNIDGNPMHRAMVGALIERLREAAQ
jgi:hypothetical protein